MGVLGGQVPLASPVPSPMVRDVARRGPTWSPSGYAIQMVATNHMWLLSSCSGASPNCNVLNKLIIKYILNLKTQYKER